MKTRITQQIMRVSGLALGILALTPTAAFAEGEEQGGIELLIPKLAELIPAVIAFCIIFFVLARMVWPSVIKMMEDRQAAIEGELQAAEDAKLEAKKTIEQADEVLNEARKEADRIVSEAKEDAENERNRILVDAHAQAAAAIEKGHKAVDVERQRAMGDLAKSVTDLSVEIAGKILEKDLNDEAHRLFVEQLLDEMGNGDAE